MKRILTMILALTMVMGILTGCGAGSDGSASGSTGGFGTKEITVSEMLDSIIEEKGEVVMYSGVNNFSNYEDKPCFKGTDFEVIRSGIVTRYDGGEWVYAKVCSNNFESLSDFITNAEEKAREVKVRINNFTPIFYTDNGKITCQEMFECKFGSVEHVEIDGTSYMLFREFNYKNDTENKDFGKCILMNLVLIEDTEYTKDKVVVFDDIKTEGFKMIDTTSENVYMTYDSNWTPNK